jgi:Tfp pilus assembly protein PilN
MKAINLLPREAQRSFGAVRSASGGTMVLFGALTAALVLVLAYVLLVNDVRSKRSELDTVNAQVAATQRQVANLKPYADLEGLRQSLLQQVRTLSDGRYDWPDMLNRVARALPSNTTLTSFNGSQGEGSDTTAPTIVLAGCTPSHDAVATVIDRLRAVKGVTGVSLQSSNIAAGAEGGSSGGSSGCTDKPETFNVTVQLQGNPTSTATAAAAAAPGTTPAPATSTTAAAPAAPTTTTAAPAGGSQ